MGEAAAQTLKVLVCCGHTRSLGDCVPEHGVETDSLPETRNQITNTGLSFSRLRTHCTIAPLTNKKRQLGQLPFALQAAARAISLEVLPVACHQLSSSHLKSLLSTIRWFFNTFPTATFYVRGIPKKILVCPGSESFMTGPMTWMISNGGSKRKGKVHPWFLSSPVDGSSQSTVLWLAFLWKLLGLPFQCLKISEGFEIIQDFAASTCPGSRFNSWFWMILVH